MRGAGAVGGRGAVPVSPAGAVTGARTHGGELITHIISPQIDAASRHNWRLWRLPESRFLTSTHSALPLGFYLFHLYLYMNLFL